MTKFIAKIIKKTTPVDRVLILLLLIGALVSIISLFRGILVTSQVQVEYLESGNEPDNRKKLFTIDIEGALISPGVYELPEGSRIKDALIAAGGYAAEADREYCEKNLNLAQELKDGQKIYIPFKSDTPPQGGYTEANIGQGRVNINTASMSELDTLWGVGEVRAQTIVKNRPYTSLEEIVSKGGMTKQILEKNRDRLVLY